MSFDVWVSTRVDVTNHVTSKSNPTFNTWFGLAFRRIQILWLLWWQCKTNLMILQERISKNRYKKQNATTVPWASPWYAMNWCVLAMLDLEEDLWNVQHSITRLLNDLTRVQQHLTVSTLLLLFLIVVVVVVKSL